MSQTDTATSPWFQARAARTEARWVANSAATSASSPRRSGASTVTWAPSSVNSTSMHVAPLRTAFGTSTSAHGGLAADGTSAPPRAWAACRPTVSMRLARHEDQALGAVARASASVSARSRFSASRSGTRSVTRRTVAGSSGSRERGGLREQQVPADQRADQVDGALVEAHPGRDRPGDRLARDAVLGQLALADVVQQRGHHQYVGPADVADQRRRLDAGLDEVPVHGEAVDHRRVRQQPDPFPLGQHPVDRAGLLERLPDRAHPRTGGQQPHEQLAGALGPRLGQGRALADQAGGAGGRQLDVALGGEGGGAEQQHRVVGGIGVGGEDHLAGGQGHAGSECLEMRPARGRRRGRPGQDVVRTPPRQAREVGDPPAELAQVSLDRRRVGQPEPRRQLGPDVGPDTVRRPPGDLVQDVAGVEEGEPGPFEVDVRDVDQPGGDQCLEHAGVAQSALGLLEVGHRHVRELAHQLVPGLDQLAQLGQPVLRGPPPVGEHLGAQPQGQVRVAGEVPQVEQAEGDAQVGHRGLEHAAEGADGVVELGPGVPERVPDLLGPRPQLDAVVAHQHDVEVRVRRQLGPPVPADRDQRGPGVGQRGGGVRLHAPLVGGRRALPSSLRGHVRLTERSLAGMTDPPGASRQPGGSVVPLRWPPGRDRRCGPGPPCRRG